MSDEMRFATKLESVPVVLELEDNTEKKCTLKELTGDQRAIYNKSFDIQIELDDKGKASAKAGKNFKSFSAKEFLGLCFYDEDNKLLSAGFIGKLPDRILQTLHKRGMEMSGLGKEAIEAAKKDLEGSD